MSTGSNIGSAIKGVSTPLAIAGKAAIDAIAPKGTLLGDAIEASSKALGEGRGGGLSDFIATGVQNTAQMFGLPGVADTLSLKSLLATHDPANRSHKGADETSPLKLEDKDLTQGTGRVTGKDITGPGDLKKYDKGFIVGGEFIDHKLVQIHDYTKLQQTASIKAFSKDFALTSEEIKKLNDTPGHKISRELGDGETRQKYDISFDKTKGTYTVSTKDDKGKEKKEENIKATDIKYGNSQLSADQHLIASSRLGFLAKKEDGSAAKIDGMLKQVQDVLAKDPGLKSLANDAHTLSYLAGSFAKLDPASKTFKVDTDALAKALPTLAKQLQADTKLRSDNSLSFASDKDADRRKKAQDTNYAGFVATAGGDDKAKTLDTQLKALGFDTSKDKQGMTQFAGSAYATSGQAKAAIDDGSLQAKIQAAYAANGNQPIPLNLMVKMAADHSTDAKGSYDDSARGADGALGTTLTLNGQLSSTRANEIQLVAQGEKGLKEALNTLDKLVSDLASKGMISVPSISVDGFFHANQIAGLAGSETSIKAQGVAKSEDIADHSKIDATDTDITDSIANLAHAGNTQSVNLTFAGCNFGTIADQLGQRVQAAIEASNKTAGVTPVHSSINVTSTEINSFAKLDASNLRADDSVSQFTALTNGAKENPTAIAVRKDQWSNDNEQATHLKTFQVDGDAGKIALEGIANRSDIGEVFKAQRDHATSSKAPAEAEKQKLNPPGTTVDNRDDSGNVDPSAFKTAASNIRKTEDESAQAAISEWERQNATTVA